MNNKKVYRAIGLMSGTSLDGVIDIALIETDGLGFVRPLRYLAHPYDIKIRDKVRRCFGKKIRDAQVEEAEYLVTEAHIDAVKAFGEAADIIGFHGQTITHDPDNGFTWQIGDAGALAHDTGIDVIADMRQADILAGGQGAPLLPLYHSAILSNHDAPVAVLNLGGVANISYVFKNGGLPPRVKSHPLSFQTPSRHSSTPPRHSCVGRNLIAFDCGTASALMDDFIKLRCGLEFDKGGKLASQGVVNSEIVQEFLSSPYFDKAPPKSLDRDNWSIDLVAGLSNADGMATLLEMSVMGVVKSLNHLPDKPRHIYVAGGGRNNDFMMERLSQALDIPVSPIDDLGYDGDAIEAQGFAYLAVRSLLGLPLTLPSTTGVLEPLTGGNFFKFAN